MLSTSPWWHWAALATTSFTREARTISEQVLFPSLTWQTNWFSREQHSILLLYRREIGAELPATTNIFLKKCAALISSNFWSLLTGAVSAMLRYHLLGSSPVATAALSICEHTSSETLKLSYLIRFFTHFLFGSVCTLFTLACGNGGRVHA